MKLTRIRRTLRASLLASLAALTVTGLSACTDTPTPGPGEVQATAAHPETAPTTRLPTATEAKRPGATAPTLQTLAASLPADTTLVVAGDIDGMLAALTPGGTPEIRASLRADYLEAFKNDLGVDASKATWLGAIAGKGEWFALVAGGGEVPVVVAETRPVAGIDVGFVPGDKLATFSSNGLTLFTDPDDIEALATAFAAPDKLAQAPSFAALVNAANAAGNTGTMSGVVALDAEWLDAMGARLPDEVKALDAIGFSGAQAIKVVATGSPEAVTNAQTAWDKMLTDALSELETEYAERSTASFDDAIGSVIGHHAVASLKKGFSPTFSGEMITFEVDPTEIFGAKGAMLVVPALAATVFAPRKAATSVKHMETPPAVAVPPQQPPTNP